MAQTVILSDGDVVFQPRKIPRSGLWDAVEADALYDVLERDVILEFYNRDENGNPTA